MLTNVSIPTQGVTYPLLSFIIEVVTPPVMSTLHHESIKETCYETAVEEFCTSNKLTSEMFAQIEHHDGVQIALTKKAYLIFDDLCQ